MALRRYSRDQIMAVNKFYGTATATVNIRKGVDAGTIRVKETFLHEGERLDSIAGRVYGDSDLYWVIAAASNIGWALQIPPGTRLLIPNLEDVTKVVG